MTRWVWIGVVVAVLAATAGVVLARRDKPAAAGPGLATVFMGDSITRGVSSTTLEPSETGSWVTHAVADPRSPWALRANVAVPGETLAQMADRFEDDVLDLEPQAVVIMGGTNDIAYGVPTEESVAALRTMVEAARADGLRVWVVAPPPLAGEYGDAIAALVEAERALADALDVTFVDGLADGSAWPEEGTFDGIHPTVEGARTLADAVLDSLRESPGSA